MLSPLASFVRRWFPFGPVGALGLFLLLLLGGLYVASLTAESLFSAAPHAARRGRAAGGTGQRPDQRPDPRPALPAWVPAGAGDDRPAGRHQQRTPDREAELRALRPHRLGRQGLHRPGAGDLPAGREPDADGEGDPILRQDPAGGRAGRRHARPGHAEDPRLPGRPDADQPRAGNGHRAGAVVSATSSSRWHWGSSPRSRTSSPTSASSSAGRCRR